MAPGSGQIMLDNEPLGCVYWIYPLTCILLNSQPEVVGGAYGY